MSVEFYNAITWTLAIGVLAAAVFAIVSLLFVVLRWKTPARRKHVRRFLFALVTIPCLIGIQQAIVWFVFLPAIGRQQVEKFEAARAESHSSTSFVGIGDPVPQFSATTADGDQFSINEAAGDVVLINFFATWCGPCRAELPHIEQIWTDRGNDPHFRLLVIGREETNESVVEFRESNGFSFPIAADPDRDIYSLFASELIPRTLVISPGGTIVYSKVGFVDSDLEELNNILDEQLAQFR